LSAVAYLTSWSYCWAIRVQSTGRAETIEESSARRGRSGGRAGRTTAKDEERLRSFAPALVAQTSDSETVASKCLLAAGVAFRTRDHNQRLAIGVVRQFCDAAAAMGHLIGYARVSTADQEPALRLDALQAAGCARVFTDRASGAIAERPELARALDHLRADDTLVVWKLDRLGRSLRHLIDTSAHSRSAAWASAACGSTSTPPRLAAGSCSMSSARLRSSSAT